MTPEAQIADETLAADFRAMFDSADVGMARIEAGSRRIVAANAQFCPMLGYPEHGLDGLTTDALLHPDDAATGQDLYAAIAEGGAANREARLLARDGAAVWVRVEVALVRDPDGKARRSIALFHYLTAAHAVAARAADDRERTRLALEAAHAGAWEFRIADRSLFWGSEFRALYGLPPGVPDPGYREWRTWVHPDDARAAEPPIADVAPRDYYSTGFRVRVGADWRWLGRARGSCAGRMVSRSA